MPNVGKKKFGYGAAGKKAAKTYAMKTGKPMKMAKAPARKKKRAQYGDCYGKNLGVEDYAPHYDVGDDGNVHPSDRMGNKP